MIFEYEVLISPADSAYEVRELEFTPKPHGSYEANLTTLYGLGFTGVTKATMSAVKITNDRDVAYLKWAGLDMVTKCVYGEYTTEVIYKTIVAAERAVSAEVKTAWTYESAIDVAIREAHAKYRTITGPDHPDWGALVDEAYADNIDFEGWTRS